MGNMSSVLLFLVFGAAVIALASWFGAKRRKELTRWAASRGLRFDPGRDSSFDDRYPEFGCLRRGHSRYALNTSEGTWNGRPMVAFDYRYVTGHGKNRSTHHFSAVIIEGGQPLKPLRIRSEGIFDRVTEFFGIDDIDFESAQFSREFHVKSQDKRWAYDVLHQGTMEFLLAAPRFSIQFDARHAIAWRNRRFDPATFEEAAGVITGILDRLPDYLAPQDQRRGET